MERITVKAPCKINLLLDCVGLLPNGYHQMDMIMQTISLWDTVTVEKTDREGIFLSCSDSQLPCDEKNIAYRCAQGFFAKAGLVPRVAIHVEKQIPMMAGLGGGSADGAGVLVALNRLFDTGITTDQLCNIGAMYGADIPFCIRGGTLRAQGIGEKFVPVPAMPACWVLVAKPLFSVSTREAFAKIDQTVNLIHPDMESMLHGLNQGTLTAVAAAMGNIFEAFCCPEKIEKIKQAMVEDGAAGALMSGSGSAVFGLFANEEQAQNCARRLAPYMEAVFLAQPVSHGPCSELEAVQ